jgi:hypothetical protein
MKTSSSRRDAHGQSLLRKLCNRVVSLLAARVARFVSEEQANACFPLLAPGVGIAPTSRLFQNHANLPQLSGEIEGGAPFPERLRFVSPGTPLRPSWRTWTQGCLHSYSFQSRAGARGAKNQDRLGGQPDSDRAIRFIALAKEQLALGSDDGLHGFPFVEGFSVSDFQAFNFLEVVVPRGNAPRSSAYQAGALLLSYKTVLVHGYWCARSLIKTGGRRR